MPEAGEADEPVMDTLRDATNATDVLAVSVTAPLVVVAVTVTDTVMLVPVASQVSKSSWLSCRLTGHE